MVKKQGSDLSIEEAMKQMNVPAPGELEYLRSADAGPDADLEHGDLRKSNPRLRKLKG